MKIFQQFFVKFCQWRFQVNERKVQFELDPRTRSDNPGPYIYYLNRTSVWEDRLIRFKSKSII